MLNRRLEQMGRTFDIHLGVVRRPLDGGPHARHRRQMDNRVGLDAGDQGGDARSIGDIEFFDAQTVADALEVHFLPRAIIEIAEVVDPDDIAPAAEQRAGSMRPDKPGCAGDENGGFGWHVRASNDDDLANPNQQRLREY